ncbi:hypothetical protein EFK50_19080 [Nocardioides marmoriginsengisoli]|uniref:Uncharacterized protein n=1 Tax=Nocardioides marmoriginsengisoli TaxID=661483 RepID=A0A3N0CAE4_9ACTN|nr:hypothetical protein [Nocardioides marmoriginsengisoli]RNL60438.1 hypothetical protein EFK50_19080 [Nocardioides marmoriginsengisoli]
MRPTTLRRREQRSLRSLIDSDDYADRLYAGRVIIRILDPELGFLDRATEHIEIQSLTFNQRRTEFQLRPVRLQKVAKEMRVAVDITPIALVPKLLFHHQRFTGSDGLNVPMVTRRENARIAQCHLVAYAVDADPELQPPSVDLWKYLGECVGRFPEQFEGDEAKFRNRAARHLNRLNSSADRVWLRRASAIPGWSRLLAGYEDNFLLTPRFPVPVTAEAAEFTIEYAEPSGSGGPEALVRELGMLKMPWRPVAFRVNEVGRARSHFVHLHAPAGTFLGFSGLQRIKEEANLLRHRSVSARSSSTFYIRRRSIPRPRSVTLLATLWPDPAGYLRPLQLVGWYTFGVTASFLFMRWPDAPGSRFLGQLDGSISLLLFLPALLVGWLFRPDESEVRRSLVYRYRLQGALCVVVIWLNLALGFFKFGEETRTYDVVTVVYAVTTFAAAYLASSINRYFFQVHEAHGLARQRDSVPSRGVGSFVLESALPQHDPDDEDDLQPSPTTDRAVRRKSAETVSPSR